MCVCVLVQLTMYLNNLENLHQSVTLYVVCLFSSTAQQTYTKIAIKSKTNQKNEEKQMKLEKNNNY